MRGVVMDGKAPAFIKLENYKNVMSVLGLLKDRISEAKALLAKINELKAEEDAIIAKWSSTLDDVSERVNESDSALLEPEA